MSLEEVRAYYSGFDRREWERLDRAVSDALGC
jgi:hypothetical protein